MEHVFWCNICQAEPAVRSIEAEIHGEWTRLDVGEKCLTSMEEAGMIE